MNPTKTHFQWYDELPEPFRSKAIENCKSHFSEKILIESRPLFHTFASAIVSGFNIYQSKEGGNYWLRVIYIQDKHGSKDFAFYWNDGDLKAQP